MKKQIITLLLLLTSTLLSATTPFERAEWARAKDKEMVGGKMIGFKATGEERKTLKLVYLAFNNEMYEAMKPTYKAKNGAKYGNNNMFFKIYCEAKAAGFNKIELTDLNKFNKVIILRNN